MRDSVKPSSFWGLAVLVVCILVLFPIVLVARLLMLHLFGRYVPGLLFRNCRRHGFGESPVALPLFRERCRRTREGPTVVSTLIVQCHSLITLSLEMKFARSIALSHPVLE